jgi:biotin carboxyl carrier protein
MKYEITVNGTPDSIEILEPAPACRFRLGDGAELAASVESPEPEAYSVLMNGQVYDARIEQHPNCLVVAIDGFRFEIEVRDPRRLAPRSGLRGSKGSDNITAPMPGKVVRVLAAAGDAVEAGQGIIVVEAMKMQNEMKAARAGRVLSVAVREGATVAAGEILATLEYSA